MQLSFCHPEFEQEARERANVFDRAITDEDVQMVIELDLSNFDFEEEDIETLLRFTNLKKLTINFGTKGSSFWNHFEKMEELYWNCWGFEVDFRVFANMKNLTWLCVSGGDYSDIAFKNLDALIALQNLEYLQLHEFGPVDLAPLGRMPQLKSFALRYTDSVKNISTIGKMTWLEELVLDGLYIENLDFLDTLPDSISLEMCGIELFGSANVDIMKWKRFKKHDICEIMVKDKWWDYVDLSAIDY